MILISTKLKNLKVDLEKMQLNKIKKKTVQMNNVSKIYKKIIKITKKK